MKKTHILAIAVLFIALADGVASANRIQYSATDAGAVSNTSDNKLSITFSQRVVRDANALTAANPLTNDDTDSGLNAGESNTGNSGSTPSGGEHMGHSGGDVL